MKIANWDQHYENAQSRKVYRLNWVPVPNKHDGERYSELMAHKDAAEIFAAWILMLQVGSRSHRRGSLLKDSGQPHTAESLAIKTRGKLAWFQKAIPYLLQSGWLERDKDDAPIPLPVNSHVDGTEGKGREGNKEEANASSSVASGAFDAWWELYPKKVGKKDALKSWTKIKPTAELVAKMMATLTVQVNSKDWVREDGRYIPNPSTWLNQGRWDDEVRGEGGKTWTP